MSSKDDARKWQIAFAQQARVELEAWQVLQATAEVAPCVRLHMLQMVCEKLAKAHLCSAGSDPDTLQSSHAYVAKTLPVIARQIVANRTGGQPRRHDQTMTEIKLLAKEIELLHPNHKANGQRPDNCEYPWKDASALVHAPANHQFPGLHLLSAASGKTLLKIIRLAIDELLK